MKKTKRIVSLACVIALTIPIATVPAMAATEDNEITLAAVSGRAEITKHSPDRRDVEATGFTSINPLDFAEDTSVDYTYSLTYYENDASKVGVDLDFTVGEDVSAYSFSAIGDVPRMELNDTTTMLRGPLYGTFIANGVEYNISASFTKLEGSNDVNIGLVITSSDFTYQKMYSFGTFIMTNDIHTAWTRYIAQQRMSTSDELNTGVAPTAVSANSNYTYIGADYGAIGPTNQTTLTGDGNRLNGFIDNEDKRVMLTLSSYCNRFNSSSFINGTFVSAYVQDFEIGLRRTSSACSISGMEEVNLPINGSNNNDLSDVFYYAGSFLDLLPPPYNVGANIIMNILASTDPATVSYINSTTHRNIQVDGGAWSEITFDNAALPVVFQLDNAATTPKAFTGVGYGTLTYVADVYVTVFYIPTETAELPITVSNVS